MKLMRWVAGPVLVMSVAACGSDDAGGESSGEGASAAWCDVATDIDAQSNELFGLSGDSPDEMKASFEQLVATLGTAVDAAPDEIKAEVELTEQALSEMNDLLAAADYDASKVDPEALEALLVDSEATAAGDEIDAYNEAECGIVAGGSGTDDTTA